MKFLFISEHLPIDTYASEVVFYRHFKMLVANGHEVHILTDQNSYLHRKKELPTEFRVHILPNRKWYYLPFKPDGILQKIRFFDYYNLYVKKILRENNISRLLGYIHGNFLTAFAAYVHEKSQIQLISFFHDDTNELHFGNESESVNKNTEKILAASTKVLIASEAFRNNWPAYQEKFVLLYPIPANFSEKKSQSSSNRPNIGYAGSVYNEIIPALDKFSSFLKGISHHFTIIGNNPKAAYLAHKYDEVTYLPLFDTAEESNDYLLANCQTCIIAYPEKIEEMPWIRTCFPSKFIQFCLLGIPTLVVAPRNSALGIWCLANKWLLYADTYDESNICILLEKAQSNEVLTQVNHLKEKVFNPNYIHQQFEDLVLN